MPKDSEAGSCNHRFQWPEPPLDDSSQWLLWCRPAGLWQHSGNALSLSKRPRDPGWEDLGILSSSLVLVDPGIICPAGKENPDLKTSEYSSGLSSAAFRTIEPSMTPPSCASTLPSNSTADKSCLSEMFCWWRKLAEEIVKKSCSCSMSKITPLQHNSTGFLTTKAATTLSAYY